MSEIISSTCTCNGASIHYQLSGSGEKKVLLLHGWGCDLSTMQSVAAALKSDMRVLSLDFPGHGTSGEPPEPWGVPDYAKAVETLLLKLDFAPCDVVAHSFGGRVAIYLAANRPSLFRSMVLTGAAGLQKQSDGRLDSRTKRFKRIKRACGIARKLPGLRGAADRAEERAVQRYGSADYRQLNPEMRKTFVKVINQDLSDCLPVILQPTLLIWGEKDTETPLWMGQRMEKEISDAGLVVFPGCGHFAYAEQPARFAAIVRQFFLGAPGA